MTLEQLETHLHGLADVVEQLGGAQDTIETGLQIQELGRIVASLSKSQVLYIGAGKQIGPVVPAASAAHLAIFKWTLSPSNPSSTGSFTTIFLLKSKKSRISSSMVLSQILNALRIACSSPLPAFCEVIVEAKNGRIRQITGDQPAQ